MKKVVFNHETLSENDILNLENHPVFIINKEDDQVIGMICNTHDFDYSYERWMASTGHGGLIGFQKTLADVINHFRHHESYYLAVDVIAKTD